MSNSPLREKREKQWSENEIAAAGVLNNVLIITRRRGKEREKAYATITRLEAEAVELRKDRDRFVWWLGPEASEAGFAARMDITGRLQDAPLDEYRAEIDAAMKSAPAETKEQDN